MKSAANYNRAGHLLSMKPPKCPNRALRILAHAPGMPSSPSLPSPHTAPQPQSGRPLKALYPPEERLKGSVLESGSRKSGIVHHSAAVGATPVT